MFPELLERLEVEPIGVPPALAAFRKSALGQFMTPAAIARFMASMFPPSDVPVCRLLDAGAGTGSLSSSFLDRWEAGDFGFSRVEAHAYEIDETLRGQLEERLNSYASRLPVEPKVEGSDFILRAAELCLRGESEFTHAILNPPYKKISSKSQHRFSLRRAGIETVNLYSAFVALALGLMAPGGELVAIIPRSFCNGPYYRSFRQYMLERAAIRHIHLFASRTKAFKDDEVLQENVIIRLQRGGQQGSVTVSTSSDDSFCDLTTHSYPFDQIVLSDDSERFIHVPTSPEPNALSLSGSVRYSLEDLGLTVSTGPVVDFRVKQHLRETPGSDTVPLLYPGHFKGKATEWPYPSMRKPDAICRNAETEKWLYPTGFYCAVRRFSSKEEKRRIVPGLVHPNAFGSAEMLGFENHLNVFHEGRRGMPEALARGLVTFLSMTAVDDQFRRFNGHTQVNATDLRLMKYPSRKELVALGEWSSKLGEPTQELIDEQLGRFA
jgi:tRNA1(Val) A37 N6-methylase TrmN6